MSSTGLDIFWFESRSCLWARLLGHQIQRPTSRFRAVTSTERTTKVSNSTPKATAKPISVTNTSGRVPRAAKVPASTTPDGYWSTVRRIFSIEAVRDRSSDTSATTRCWASRLFSAKCS